MKPWASRAEAECARAPAARRLSEEGAQGRVKAVCASACLSVLISATLLPALVRCQGSRPAPASSRGLSRTQGAVLPPRDLSKPAARGDTHQLHLRPQSFQDAVSSLCLLLQGGKGEEKLFLTSVTVTALCSSSAPVPKPLPKHTQNCYKSPPI